MRRVHRIVFETLAISLAATLVCAIALRLGHTDWLESVSFISGVACVWLTVRESIWNFPIGMLNVALFLVVFARGRLWADTGLQVVYFILGVIGWYLWLFGGANRTPLIITSAPRRRLAGVGLAMILLFAALLPILRLSGGNRIVFDALTTSLSLGAQWLLDRKHLENWILWIIADVIYIPLYAYKHLYLTSGLNVVFLTLAIIGLVQWHRMFRQQQLQEGPP